MASTTMAIISNVHQFRSSNKVSVKIRQYDVLRSQSMVNFCITQQKLCKRFLYSSKPHEEGLGCSSTPLSAVGSGLEASISEPPKGNAITLKNANISVESQDVDKLQLRVDVTGEETQKVFDQVLTNLARSAPPIPGFRRQKGGKTTQVPKSFLLQVLGEERVTKFVIQEIVSTSVADYVKNENLKVKENKLNTTQTADELKKLFAPGKEFGFNATLELEISENETESSDPPSSIMD